MLKKIISLLLVVLMMVFNLSSYAKEIDEPSKSFVEYEEENGISGSNTLNIASLPELKVTNLEEFNGLKENKHFKNTIDLEEANLINKGLSWTNSNEEIMSLNSVTETFSGTITQEGGIAYLIVTLYPNEILQTNMICPNNPDLNYDLFLYEYNEDGTLGNMVDYSATETYFNVYPDGTIKTLDESIGYINSSSDVKSYAIIIMATVGSSASDPYTLTVSLDTLGNYDGAEPNDSPYHAYEIEEGILSGANLNVKNDQDWFVWNVPSTINGMQLTVDNVNYTTEVYTTSGSAMILENMDSDGIYNLDSGYYYIRVLSSSETFVKDNYELTIQPYGAYASSIILDFNGDMGANLVSYPEGRHYRFKNTLTPTATVLDASGYPVRNQEVTLTWLSGAWSENSGNSKRTQVLTTDSSGKATFNLTVPPAIGDQSYYIVGPITFEHYYDIDGIVLTTEGASVGEIVYHFAYSIYISS